MSLGITRENIMYNGAAYRGTVSTIKPTISLLAIRKMQWPENYSGMYHPDDLASSTPIKCVRTNPNIMTIIPIACRPNDAWLAEFEPEKWAEKQALMRQTVTTMPVTNGQIYRPEDTRTVIELTDSNGKTTPIIVDDKTENLAPLVMLAGLAALLFMGG